LQEIAVVGAGGKMGSWFTSYFARRRPLVSIYDINRRSLKASRNIRIAGSIKECVKSADLVLVCVPVRLTPKVVAECAKSMKAGAVIAEISSVKHRTFQALARLQRDLRPLCIHPMFGPGASESKKYKVLLVPVRNEEAELKTVHEMFENVVVKMLPDAKTHDESMAMVLGLTYFANVIFAKVITRGNLELLKEISGTTFGLQLLLAESILTDEPDLIVALIRENPLARKYIRQYLKEASATAKLVSTTKSSKGLEADLRKVKSRMQKQKDLQQSYRRMYDISEGLK
jgi:prephenate dehydrogenase